MHQGGVIGKARDLKEGAECDGWIDSPDQHVTFWEDDPAFWQLRQSGTEYQDVPRGRAVWNQKADAPVIYMDKKLLRSETMKKKVAAFFGLDASLIQWKSDPHYTTDPKEISALLDE